MLLRHVLHAALRVTSRLRGHALNCALSFYVLVVDVLTVSCCRAGADAVVLVPALTLSC
jgi:hypothetical protein